MDKRIGNLIKIWQKGNIEGIRCIDRHKALEKILEIIPKTASVGFSGSVTLDELGAIGNLESRGNKVFNPYQEGISRGESLEIRRQAAGADYYLASANALSEKGELVFFSAYGNRTAGIAYANNVIIVCGINKLTFSLSEAIKRAREYTAPLNCKRLNWGSACLGEGICRNEVCFAPEYKRMCCQVLIIEAEVSIGRLKVILVEEKLGF